MGSFPTSGSAWMAIAGALACCTTLYMALLYRIALKNRGLKSRGSFKRSMLLFSRAGRSGRLNRFENIARVVLSDVEAALQPPLCHRHARSFLPIIADVRKRGQTLLSQQTYAHRVTSPVREKALADLVMRIFNLESQLKALPKPSVTIEEVLSGKFE
ncbi:MAG: hypothetical protein RI953_745 [Pseudomonadota bacterium]|jgi:hypothetical protein